MIEKICKFILRSNNIRIRVFYVFIFYILFVLSWIINLVFNEVFIILILYRE